MSTRRLKEKLHKRNPYCYWCKKPTVLAPSPSNGRHFPNEATIDHLISRWHSERFQKGSEIVLACYECNYNRNLQEQEKIPLEMRQARSAGELIYLS